LLPPRRLLVRLCDPSHSGAGNTNFVTTPEIECLRWRCFEAPLTIGV
jgi:hypothetical protein